MAKYDSRREIVIFDGGGDGYGDAVKHPDRSSYNWTYNWDCREHGRAVPALAPIKITPATFNNLNRQTCAFAWEDPTTLRPFILVGMGLAGTSNTYLLRDGTYDVEGSDSSSSARVSGGVLFRHDGSTADNEMAYFSRATAPGATAALWQRNKSATPTYADTGHTISPYGIYVTGSDLWIVSPNGYEVQKWTLDTDPGLSGSYGTPIPVGRPTYPVNHIANLGGSPLCIKGDGIFKYDPSTSVAQFISVLNFSSPHKENGLATASDGRGRVYVPSVEGHLIVITAGFQSSQTPARDRQIDRDTPYGTITAMACDMDYIYAAIEPGQRQTEQLGMKVILRDVGVSNTDVTTNVTDGKFATVADTTGLSGTDKLLIGADEPFLGAYLRMNVTGDGALSVRQTQVSYSSAADTFTSAGASHDSTSAFAKDGLITVQVTGNTDIYASGAWVKTTAYSGSAEKYWMQVDFSGGVTMGLATIAEIRLIPYRPPLDTTLFPETAYAIGGALTPILVGQWHGESIIWDHVWTLDSARIEQMVVASGECGAVPSKRALYCFDAQLNAFVIPVGPDAAPARASWPKLADYSESGTAFDTHAIGFSAIDFGEVVQFSKGLEIDMTAVQSDDTVAVYARWDEDYTRGYQKLADHKGRKHFFTKPPEGMGRILYTYLQYSDGSRTAMAPVLHSVTIPPGAWAPVPDFELQEANIPSPQQT